MRYAVNRLVARKQLSASIPYDTLIVNVTDSVHTRVFPSIAAADLVVPDIVDALDLLAKPLRLIAMLRS